MPLNALWEVVIPESRMAMPTPVPSRPVYWRLFPLPLVVRTAEVVAPTVVSRRLAVRAVSRLGEILWTSEREAMPATWLAGNIADRAVTEMKRK